MAHAIGAHPVHWHVDPEIRQHVSIYNAHRRKNQAGWGVKDSLDGEGFKLENRSKYLPFLEQHGQSDDTRESREYWRKQERDQSGRTVCARTLENCYVTEWQRSATPDDAAPSKNRMRINVLRMREKDKMLRRARTPNPFTDNEPISDKDILGMCDGVVAEGKRGQIKRWLSTASVVEKDQFRQLLANVKRLDGRHRFARADVLDLSKEEHAPPIATVTKYSDFVKGNEKLQYRASLQTKVATRLRGHFMDVMKAFEREDPDNIGDIPVDAIVHVLASFGLPLPPEEVEVLSMLFENERGMILYREFLETFLPRTVDAFKATSALPEAVLKKMCGGEFHASATPEQILDALRLKVVGLSGVNALQNAFRKFDINRDGSIDTDEMLEVLHLFGIHVSLEQAERLMDLCDRGGDRKIDYVEFVRLVMPSDFKFNEKGAMVFGPGPAPSEQEDRKKAVPPGKYQQKFMVPLRSSFRPNMAMDDVSIVEGMRKQLQDHVQQRFPNMRLTFKAMLHSTPEERSSENKVSLFSFRKFLKTMMIGASVQESHALFDYLDRDKDGWLDYNDLVASLGVLAKNVSHKDAVTIRSGSADPSLAGSFGNFKGTGLSDSLRPRTSDTAPKFHQRPNSTRKSRDIPGGVEVGGAGRGTVGWGGGGHTLGGGGAEESLRRMGGRLQGMQGPSSKMPDRKLPICSSCAPAPREGVE